MRRSPMASSFSLIAGVILFALWSSGRALAATDHQLAIGVVRTGQIMRNMPEMKKFQADGRARLAELQQQQQQHEMELQDLQKHRDNMVKPGSQQWTDETAAIDKKRAELEVWKQISSLQLERWQKQSIKDMYDHLTAATAQVAQAQHLDMVVADQAPDIGPDMDKANAAQLDTLLGQRAVLFANKKADITDDVLTQLEANFAKQGQLPGPPPVPAPTTGTH